MQTAVEPSGNRDDIRLKINVGHEITVIKIGDQAPNRAQLLDISDLGLGIIASRAIAPSTRVRIFTIKNSFEAEVIWCRAGINAGKVYHRIGLRLLSNQAIDLSSTFSYLAS